VDAVLFAGNARRGQSLIVWAINEGRQCARVVDRYLSSLSNSYGSLPEDDALSGHADADEGPEGPPQHVHPAITAGEEN